MMTQTQSYQCAAKAYGNIEVQGRAEDASPHRIIQMLMESALQQVVLAKGMMQQKRVSEKGNSIGMAISIVEGMRISLDHEQGGELAGNLEALYEYISVRLLEANISDDESKLDEVLLLLTQLKSGWDALPAQMEQGVQ